MKILGICGSLRKDSYNLSLLKNLEKLFLAGEFEIVTLHEIPLYDQDVEDVGFPDSVVKLVDKIVLADALVFGCPEYNYSVPGVLKNAIDWVSRHPKKAFSGKKAAVISASMGRLGGARAQYHLRQIAVFVNLYFLNRPEIMLGEAQNKFDSDGNLTDTQALDLLKKLVVNLREDKKAP